MIKVSWEQSVHRINSTKTFKGPLKWLFFALLFGMTLQYGFYDCSLFKVHYEGIIYVVSLSVSCSLFAERFRITLVCLS